MFWEIVFRVRQCVNGSRNVGEDGALNFGVSIVRMYGKQRSPEVHGLKVIEDERCGRVLKVDGKTKRRVRDRPHHLSI